MNFPILKPCRSASTTLRLILAAETLRNIKNHAQKRFGVTATKVFVRAGRHYIRTPKGDFTLNELELQENRHAKV